MKKTNELPAEPLTIDTFFHGHIRVMQHRSGYRFSIDAVLLAYHAGLRTVDSVLDLGTGCGIIPLIMAYRNPQLRIYGIEVQSKLAELAQLNVKENRMEKRISIFCEDMKALNVNIFPNLPDLIVCNPPYRKADSGRINPNMERAIARHEIMANLSDVLDISRRILQISGKFIMIYPAERIAEALIQMHNADIEPKFIRVIHSAHQSEARLLIAEGVKGGNPGVKIGPPLIIYDKDGNYTDEVNVMYGIEDS